MRVTKYLKYFLLIGLILFSIGAGAQSQIKLKKKDRKRDIEMVTTEGTIILRLSDSTPLHRDNFFATCKKQIFRQFAFSSRDTIFYDTGR